MKFAFTLKVARVRKNLTQCQLADRTGISQTTISHLENGVHQPQNATKAKIEEILGPVDWPLTYDEQKGRKAIH